MLVLMLTASSSAAVAFNVRSLQRGDVFAASRLLQVSFNGAANPLSRLLIVAENVAGLRERCDANIMLVATENGASNHGLIGFVEVYTPEFLASAAGKDYPERVKDMLQPYVASLAVAAAARRRGVGEALMRAVELRCAGKQLSLEVEEDNRAAVMLYERLGYSCIGRDTQARRLDGDLLFGKSVGVTKLKYIKTASVPPPAEAASSSARASWLVPQESARARSRDDSAASSRSSSSTLDGSAEET